MDGSFIVVPLKDKRKRVFGLLGLDTLKDIHGRAIFITHEIQFFQVCTAYICTLPLWRSVCASGSSNNDDNFYSSYSFAEYVVPN